MTTAVRQEAGFTLVEALVAAAIVLVVTGLACGLALQAQQVWRGESARVDVQQRARVAADVLRRALLDAGAGAHAGPARGPLLRRMPPLVPRRLGRRGAHPVTSFRQDAFTVLRASPHAEHGMLLLPLPPGGTTIELAPGTACILPACGFATNETALVLDQTGNFDVFTVVGVTGQSLALRHHGDGAHPGYQAGSPVLEADVSTFYIDRTSGTLRQYDGDAADFPLIDDVVEMRVEYYADREPPVRPRPPDGVANCLYESDGTYRAAAVPVLSGPGAAYVALSGGSMTDGPWCGAGSNQWDADLLRLRRVRATVRLQAADASVRGADAARFSQPGHANDSSMLVPDVTVVVDVTPRNLHIAW